MILLDAYALVAFMGGERAAGDVEKLLRTVGTSIPAANLAETLDVLVRVRRHPLPRVETLLVPLLGGGLEVM